MLRSLEVGVKLLKMNIGTVEGKPKSHVHIFLMSEIFVRGQTNAKIITIRTYLDLSNVKKLFRVMTNLN